MIANPGVSRLSDFSKTNSGWKYYKQIKKKAMEQEFSWSGLLLSLSIAFFIVMITAYSLNLLLASYKNAKFDQQVNRQIYQLETSNPSQSEKYLHLEKFDYNKIRYYHFTSLNLV
jgi:hypothetical protein